MINFLYKYGIIFILVYFLLAGSVGIFFNYGLFNTVGDESPLLSSTLKMIAEHSLRPDYPSFYHLPFAVYLYLPFFVIALGVMYLSGMSIGAIEKFGAIDFAKFLPLARFISVLVGCASIYLLYRIAIKIFKSKRISLLAAFLLSTSLMFFQMAHLARIWLPQVFTILLAFYILVCLYEKEKIRIINYILAGLGVGLSFGTHLIGIIIYVPFLVIHYYKNKGHGFLNIFLKNNYFWSANLIFILIYFLVYYLNPYGLNHYAGGLIPKIFQLFPSVGTVVQEKAFIGGVSGVSNFFGSVKYFIIVLWQYEPLLFLISSLGFVLIFLKKRNYFYIFFSFIIAYFILISLTNSREPRFILPIIPFMALAGSFGLVYLSNKIKNNKIVISLTMVLCFLFLFTPILWDYRFSQASTRLEAAKWIYANLAPGESIINLDATLELNENRKSIEDIAKYSDFLTKKRVYLLALDDKDFPQPNYYIFFYYHYKQLPEEIITNKFNYLIISWYNKNELVDSLLLLDKFKYEKNPVLIRRFPEGANENSRGMDLAGNMENPLINLLNLKQNGPVVDIYKIEN